MNEAGLLGKVLIGNTSQPICVPGNSAFTISGRLGRTTKIPTGTPCLADTAGMHNLPQGISVNHRLSHPKGKVVLVIVMNQNNHNVWLLQTLLAAEMFWVEHLPWDYGVEFHQEGNKIEVAFQPLTMADIMASVQVVHNEKGKMSSKEEARGEPHSTFGPHPNTQVAATNAHGLKVQPLKFVILGGSPSVNTKLLSHILTNAPLHPPTHRHLSWTVIITAIG